MFKIGHHEPPTSNLFVLNSQEKIVGECDEIQTEFVMKKPNFYIDWKRSGIWGYLYTMLAELRVGDSS